jgi:hypothetical protein
MDRFNKFTWLKLHKKSHNTRKSMIMFIYLQLPHRWMRDAGDSAEQVFENLPIQR